MTTGNAILFAAGAVASLVLAAFFFERLVTPRLNRRLLKRIVQDIRKGKAVSKQPPEYLIRFDSTGLVVTPATGYGEAISLSWNDVQKVEAFKRDLFAVDLVCLFFSGAGNKGLEVDEEMGGWSELVEALPNYLPSCQRHEKWFLDVAFPAFETNHTEIFRRSIVLPATTTAV